MIAALWLVRTGARHRGGPDPAARCHFPLATSAQRSVAPYLLARYATVTPRQWRLSVDVLEDATLSASVTADDQLLMPMARFRTPSEALAYFEATLVDFRRGDSLSTILTARGARPHLCLLSNRDGVLSWLGPLLVDLWHEARQGFAAQPSAIHPSNDGPSDGFTSPPVTRIRRRRESRELEIPATSSDLAGEHGHDDHAE